VKSAYSSIRSEWRVTIPREVRKKLQLKIGQRIAWKVTGETLTGIRVRTISELAGCFKPGNSPKNFAEMALARHDRLSKKN
jgi:bifunctional DNA-binding transcriptional regulator/antitoxin component of YhaV-PrlF toxin-antitoxin module